MRPSSRRVTPESRCRCGWPWAGWEIRRLPSPQIERVDVGGRDGWSRRREGRREGRLATVDPLASRREHTRRADRHDREYKDECRDGERPPRRETAVRDAGPSDGFVQSCPRGLIQSHHVLLALEFWCGSSSTLDQSAGGRHGMRARPSQTSLVCDGTAPGSYAADSRRAGTGDTRPVNDRVTFACAIASSWSMPSTERRTPAQPWVANSEPSLLKATAFAKHLYLRQRAMARLPGGRRVAAGRAAAAWSRSRRVGPPVDRPALPPTSCRPD